MRDHDHVINMGHDPDIPLLQFRIQLRAQPQAGPDGIDVQKYGIRIPRHVIQRQAVHAQLFHFLRPPRSAFLQERRRVHLTVAHAVRVLCQEHQTYPGHLCQALNHLKRHALNAREKTGLNQNGNIDKYRFHVFHLHTFSFTFLARIRSPMGSFI